MDILEMLEKEEDCSQGDIVSLLRCDDPEVVEKLFTIADTKRKKYVGDGVHLRGLVEFSNFCRKNCFYCGLRKENKKLKRYRMSFEEIYALCERIARLGIRTIVLQSGEDTWYEAKTFAELIHRIKKLGVAVTLSLGEREPWEYALWRDAGADRYLLKQETFDRELFVHLHPDDDYDKRLECQKVLKDLGYQVGSGNMVGLPYQTCEALALDIKKFQEWDFDMIGIGPFIPHPDTPLGEHVMDPEAKCLLTLKVLALTRILTKNTNLPATTALGTLVPGGRERGLRCGANVLMPNFTPSPYRMQYTIYPGKICVQEAWGNCLPCMEKMVTKLGRTVATGFGDRVRNSS
ncbi:MAG: [FeFe] hydrogenase H-cluster radical SAM maturase HydE [Atribacterota bacterium]